MDFEGRALFRRHLRERITFRRRVRTGPPAPNNTARAILQKASITGGSFLPGGFPTLPKDRTPPG